MFGSRGTAALASLVSVVVGCTQLLGDDFVVGDGGSTHSQPQGGSGGAGGAVPTGGSAGEGGVDPGPCVVGEVGNCGPNHKCSVVDYATGETGCVLAGPRPAFSRCDGDANCGEGSFCDPPSSICLPVCGGDADCANGGPCVTPGDENGNVIHGVKVCIANCNLITGSPCDQSYGPVTCVPAGDGTLTHCWQGGGSSVDSTCVEINECAVGLICAPDVCRAWCTPPGVQASCPAGLTCVDVAITHEGVAYGVCG